MTPIRTRSTRSDSRGRGARHCGRRLHTAEYARNASRRNHSLAPAAPPPSRCFPTISFPVSHGKTSACRRQRSRAQACVFLFAAEQIHSLSRRRGLTVPTARGMKRPNNTDTLQSPNPVRLSLSLCLTFLLEKHRPKFQHTFPCVREAHGEPFAMRHQGLEKPSIPNAHPAPHAVYVLCLSPAVAVVPPVEHPFVRSPPLSRPARSGLRMPCRRGAPRASLEGDPI